MGKRLIMARLNLKYTIISRYVPAEDAKEAREIKTATKNILRPGKGTEDDGQKQKQGINRKG